MKKAKSTVSAKSSKKHGAHRARRATKQTGTALQRLSGGTRRLVKSTPVRVLLGASAIAFAVAKLRHLV
jgi:hypothetical protein